MKVDYIWIEIFVQNNIMYADRSKLLLVQMHG